jgi:transposase
LQTVLIEVSKIATMSQGKLREIYDQARAKGNANQATLQVARKLVAYLLAVDRAFFAAAETIAPNGGPAATTQAA